MLLSTDPHTAMGPQIRRIWVRRDDGHLEYKIWYIYDLFFCERALDRFRLFLETENERVQKHKEDRFQAADRQKAASFYGAKENIPLAMPARLLALPEKIWCALPTALVKGNDFILGDSVGGIAPDKPAVHQSELAKEVEISRAPVLFSPGLLCRIPVAGQGEAHYLFQLAVKNLKEKGEVFYKPIGGHLRYREAFIDRMEEFGVHPKKDRQIQGGGDVDFIVDPLRFFDFISFFEKEILLQDGAFFFPLGEILNEEVREELGPCPEADGFPLLDEREVLFKI